MQQGVNTLPWRRKISVDLSTMTLEELQKLAEQVQKTLEIRSFEEGLNQAVQEYKRRDPEVIRF